MATMGRAAAQVAAVQIPIFRILKVIKVVLTSNLARVISSSSRGIPDRYHVFTTSLCKRDQKLHKRAVNAVEPAVPRYLRWSEQPIVWSREDHPPRVDNPGHLALVVAPQVVGYKFTNILMDGGSSINILYYETFRRMGLTDKNLNQSNTVWRGAW